MGSSARSSLPVIDLSEGSLKTVSPSSWASKCDQVRVALENYGCFVAIYDQVSAQLCATLFEVLGDVFDQPAEAKARNVSDAPYHGYIGDPSEFSPFESVGIEYATTPFGVRRFTTQIWPSGNDSFYETMISYAKETARLDQLVVKMLCESYGIKNFYQSYEDVTNYSIRANKYKKPLETPAHTDQNFFTVLSQNEINGLLVKAKNGDDWLGYEPLPSSFVVIAGEAAMAWSNGRVHAVQHRVSVTSSTPRYSVVNFSYNKGTIDIAEELVDDEHPRKFRSFDHYGLLAIYIPTVAGQEYVSNAVAYCGI